MTQFVSKKVITFFVFAIIFMGFSGLSAVPVNTVFAENDHGDNQDSSNHELRGEHQDSQISEEQNHTRSNDQNESENKTVSEHDNENKTISEDHNENKTMTMSEGEMNQHEGEDSPQELEHQKNNERITHHETDQERSHIEDAKTNQTIAAEIEIGNGNVDHKSIDNNIVVQTLNSSANSVNISVSATNQTGPKVILVNLNSTTIDVSSIRYLHVLYDGKVITPADNVDQVIHATSSDDPHYAILITTNGAQVLISIPHFSTHTITLDSLSKVIPAIPEFPFAILALMIGIFSIILIPKIRLSTV
jgi:hypothetical protein